MKRRFAGRSGSLTATAQGEQGFWPSYADMMSAVALILFCLMLISYIQNLITGNNLENTKEQLEDMRVRLSSTQLNLKNTEDRLSRTQSSLSDTQIALTETELSLSDTLRAVADAQSQLDIITGELDSARLTLTQQQDELSAQDELLASREALLADQAALIAQQQAFVDAANDENAKYVDSIVISGHTDSSGTDDTNRVLSTARANAVLGYLMDKDSGKLDDYASYFCAAGYGKTRPVASNETKEGRAANRRIEISIILRDDTVMDIVESYLDIELPELPEMPEN